MMLDRLNDLGIDYRTGKIRNWNSLIDSVESYKKIRFVENSQVYVATMPVIRRMTKRELVRLFIQAGIGAIVFYVVMVLALACIPPELAF